jgi:hypothetical protein
MARAVYRDAGHLVGLIWRGRPDFVGLQELILEAEAWRVGATVLDDGQCSSHGGPRAVAWAYSDELLAMVPANITEISHCFLYYDTEGAHIKPHVDIEHFSINAILMLVHSAQLRRTSQLVLYPPDAEPERIFLEPGEMIIMHASRLRHERTPVSKGEVVRLISVGMRAAQP